MFVVVNGVLDLSGNGKNFFESTFTTAAGTDNTAPTVVMVTPANGASGIGLNAAVVLSFSKSLNRNTINGNTVGLLVNGSKLGIGINVSADNRAVTLNAGTLPASSTVTVVATTGVTDLAGNALGDFESSFTTAAAVDTTHPGVMAQRAGERGHGSAAELERGAVCERGDECRDGAGSAAYITERGAGQRHHAGE